MDFFEILEVSFCEIYSANLLFMNIQMYYTEFSQVFIFYSNSVILFFLYVYMCL